MIDDRPPYVLAAEALGCKPMHLAAAPFSKRSAGWYCGCIQQCPVQWVPPSGTVAGGEVFTNLVEWNL